MGRKKGSDSISLRDRGSTTKIILSTVSCSTSNYFITKKVFSIVMLFGAKALNLVCARMFFKGCRGPWRVVPTVKDIRHHLFLRPPYDKKGVRFRTSGGNLFFHEDSQPTLTTQSYRNQCSYWSTQRRIPENTFMDEIALFSTVSIVFA